MILRFLWSPWRWLERHVQRSQWYRYFADQRRASLLAQKQLRCGDKPLERDVFPPRRETKG